MAIGDIRSVDTFLEPFVAIIFLHAAVIFFLQGVIALQRKRRTIKALQNDQAIKLEELMRLTRELGEANIRAREADHMKSEFLANMSHELRTPLNSIIGFSEILKGNAGENPAKRERFLGNINRSGEHLLGIINDILDLSKIQAGKMEFFPEPIHLPLLIDGVAAVMHGMAAKRQIEFSVELEDDLPTLRSDPSKLKQVLFNLLSNAVKFSPEGSTIEIRAWALDSLSSAVDVDSIVIAVRDTGVGIPAEDQQLIFHEFRQTRDRHHAGGSGLGLALVRRFIELQGGIVELDSEPGVGSEFRIILPLEPMTEDFLGQDLVGLQQLDDNNLRPRVLVVEDDLVAYRSISQTLDSAGFQPVRARHGEEALELARVIKPVAITLDLGLPRLSGWGVLNQLKDDAETRDIPVVVVSLMKNRELGLTLGADDYFVKPVDPKVLADRIKALTPGDDSARILVIDDDPLVHLGLQTALEAAGHQIVSAHTGTEGLLAAATEPDAIILDLMLPDMTGFEVADHLASQPDTADIPILVLTAKDLSRAERSALEGKISALLTKGRAAPERLVDAIQELRSRRR